ncbi:MAG: M3 family metallopeptidase [Bacteroidales bacterium]|nr:M3 family metallopeptidase [Bacteroidales bacterium]
MLKSSLIIAICSLLVFSCNVQTTKLDETMNPFLSEYNTPFDVPPFGKIKNEHFMPAILAGIEKQKLEIDAIVTNPDNPTFQNTIEALDASGMMLRNVTNVFENLQSANTNEELQKIAKDAAPLISGSQDDILLNQMLFDKIATVYNQMNDLQLSTEQKTLLEKTYKRFARNGAALNEPDKAKLRKINEELSLLSLQFDENLLAETNDFKLIIDNTNDLAGLPQSAINGAAEAAAEAGHQGKWMFTLHKPSFIPYLQYGENRELRRQLLEGYINRCNNNNAHDNKMIAAKEAALRVERANLLGYPTHADYVLEVNMAKNPEIVYNFLNEILDPARTMATKEAAELQKMIDAEGGNFKLEPWDWWYYAEKLKMQQYDLDEEQLRPYFELENVLAGMQQVATNLYGITFKTLDNVPGYHPEVRTFEVLESDGSHIGILFMDFYPRASKGGGAWMTSYRKQYKLNGENVAPVISMVMNFSKPTGGKPALLNFDEVSTMFHEFGHALHGLLSNCNYITLSGTSVPRDFVELPSQVMENWAGEPEVMKSYARHYETGTPIPEELIEKIKNSSKFNQGFATLEYLSACYLDMDWHTLKTAEEQDALTFENNSMKNIGMIPEIVVRYRSSYFSHIFAGGYSSGYYSYLWAEILDADAFEAFKEKGLFDQETAKAFRENVLEKGGTDDPMTLYKNFRGREPNKDAMLKRKGLI